MNIGMKQCKRTIWVLELEIGMGKSQSIGMRLQGMRMSLISTEIRLKEMRISLIV